MTTLQRARDWANKNAAGWLLELLYDERPAAKRGPLRDTRTCDNVADYICKANNL